MDYELSAIIVKSKNNLFDEYAKDLEEFGYKLNFCNADVSEIITQSIKTECDLILLSQNDFETEEDIIELIRFFTDKKEQPLILNMPTKQSLTINHEIDRHFFIYNIFPTGVRRSIILDIERKDNFRNKSCDKLLFLLKQKVMYDCSFIGLNRTHEGYRWICEAVLLIIADSFYQKNFSAGVYKILENKYNATYTQIEPAIRRCMAYQYDRMTPYIKEYYLDLDPNSNQKYTTTHFINKMADNIKIQYKRNYRAFMDIAEYDRKAVVNAYFKIKK